MAKEERLYTALEAAYMCRMTLSSLRVKISRMKFKPAKKEGKRVLYTREQVQAIHDGNGYQAVKKAKKVVKKTAKRKTKKG